MVENQKEIKTKPYRGDTLVLSLTLPDCRWIEYFYRTPMFLKLHLQIKQGRLRVIREGQSPIRPGQTVIREGHLAIRPGENPIREGETRIREPGKWIRAGGNAIRAAQTAIRFHKKSYSTGSRSYPTGVKLNPIGVAGLSRRGKRLSGMGNRLPQPEGYGYLLSFKFDLAFEFEY